MDVKVFVICARSATSKAGKPYFQCWLSRWDESTQSFSRPVEQFIEPEEYQNLCKMVPCTAYTSNHFRVTNDGQQTVECKGFVKIEPIALPWLAKAATAKAG